MNRAAHADRGFVVLLAAAAYTAVLVLWLGLGLGSDGLRVWLADVGILPITGVAVAFLWRAGREPGIGARTRRAWLILAAAFASYGLANLVWAVRQVMLGLEPESTVVSLLYFAYYPLVLWGLLTFPTVRGSKRDVRIFWLDVASVLVGAAMLMGYFVFLPVMRSEGELLDKIVSIGYPTADFAILFAIGAALTRNPSPRLVGSLWMLGLSFLLVFIADFGYAVATVSDGFDSGGWTDGFWMAHELFAAASAQLLILRNRAGARWKGSRRDDVEPGGPRMTFLPYAGILLGYGLVLYVSAANAPRHMNLILVLGGVLILLILLRQVTAVRATEEAREALRESEKRFRALVQHASDLVTVVDLDGIVAYQGASAERILGRAPLSNGSVIEELIHPEDQQTLRDTLALSRSSPGIPVRGEWRALHASGSWRHLETYATNLVGDGVIDGIVLNSSDITERKTMEEELMHRAFHDPLTGIANRSLFSNILDLALIRGRRSGKGIAVLFLDLDNFKTVNDALGHGMGDSLLVQAAERLKHEVRVTDTVARLGGDEFAVLLDEMASVEDAHPVTSRILSAMRLSVTTSEGHVIQVTASIGLALASGVDSREEMLRKADAAMYEAKRAGGNRIVQYTDAGAHVLATEAVEEADLRRAIELGEFVLRYQPIVALGDDRIAGVQAQVRWFHPRQGLLPPEEFMPLAERTGLDVSLGYHVLEEAAQQMAIWHARFPEASLPAVNLGVARRQLREPGFAAAVLEILGRTGLRPAALVLELPEPDLLDRRPDVLAPIQALRKAGVRIAVGEFGAGCRVLNSLADLPVDVIRIAPVLVEDLVRGSPLAAGAVLRAARELDVTSLAGAADTGFHVDALAQAGCELAVGQQLSPPLTRDQMEDLLRRSSLSAPALARAEAGQPAE
jgi:diguanylate cyclase (GGDEF)-like protein/PAS domain S-box-containing protein